MPKKSLAAYIWEAELAKPKNPQSVIPGAERISAGELAQRMADKPLRPRVPQKPAEHGMFSDSHKQKELFK